MADISWNNKYIEKIFNDNYAAQHSYTCVRELLSDLLYTVSTKTNSYYTGNDYLKFICGFHVTADWWTAPKWFLLNDRIHNTTKCKNTIDAIQSLNTILTEYRYIMEEEKKQFDVDTFRPQLRMVLVRNDDLSLLVRTLDMSHKDIGEAVSDIYMTMPMLFQRYIENASKIEPIEATQLLMHKNVSPNIREDFKRCLGYFRIDQ